VHQRRPLGHEHEVLASIPARSLPVHPRNIARSKKGSAKATRTPLQIDGTVCTLGGLS
jgi:hypothetical protein